MHSIFAWTMHIWNGISHSHIPTRTNQRTRQKKNSSRSSSSSNNKNTAWNACAVNFAFAILFYFSTYEWFDLIWFNAILICVQERAQCVCVCLCVLQQKQNLFSSSSSVPFRVLFFMNSFLLLLFLVVWNRHL